MFKTVWCWIVCCKFTFIIAVIFVIDVCIAGRFELIGIWLYTCSLMWLQFDDTCIRKMNGVFLSFTNSISRTREASKLVYISSSSSRIWTIGLFPTSREYLLSSNYSSSGTSVSSRFVIWEYLRVLLYVENLISSDFLSHSSEVQKLVLCTGVFRAYSHLNYKPCHIIRVRFSWHSFYISRLVFPPMSIFAIIL